MSRHYQIKETRKKANWIVAGIGVFFVLVIGALLASTSSTSPASTNQGGPSKASPIEALEKAYDFGTISMAKGVVKKTYKIKNPTSETITINKIYTSCMCTKATLYNGDRRAGPFGMPGHGVIPTINETLAPEAEATIEAVFDPAAHGPAGVGSIARDIYVETADGGKLNLAFKAQVTP